MSKLQTLANPQLNGSHNGLAGSRPRFEYLMVGLAQRSKRYAHPLTLLTKCRLHYLPTCPKYAHLSQLAWDKIMWQMIACRLRCTTKRYLPTESVMDERSSPSLQVHRSSTGTKKKGDRGIFQELSRRQQRIFFSSHRLSIFLFVN